MNPHIHKPLILSKKNYFSPKKIKLFQSDVLNLAKLSWTDSPKANYQNQLKHNTTKPKLKGKLKMFLVHAIFPMDLDAPKLKNLREMFHECITCKFG